MRQGRECRRRTEEVLHQVRSCQHHLRKNGWLGSGIFNVGLGDKAQHHILYLLLLFLNAKRKNPAIYFSTVLRYRGCHPTHLDQAAKLSSIVSVFRELFRQGGGQPVNFGRICHLVYRGGPHSNRPNQLVSSVLTGFLGYFFSNFYEYMWWFLHKEAFNQLAKMRLTGQMG